MGLGITGASPNIQAQQLQAVTEGLGKQGLRQLKEEFEKAYRKAEARKLDSEDSLLREVTDVLKNELARLTEINKSLSEENAVLRGHIHGLEDRLLKAIDLAHKVMEKFSDEKYVPSKDQLPRGRDDPTVGES